MESMKVWRLTTLMEIILRVLLLMSIINDHTDHVDGDKSLTGLDDEADVVIKEKADNHEDIAKVL